MTLELKTENRKPKQKAEGKIPVVLYGPEVENTLLLVDLKEFKKIWREAGESTVVDLEMGGSKKPVLIYDVQVDPLTSEPIHADFYAVDMTKKITTEISLEFVGEAPAIKLGGTLVKVLHEVEVEALPADLPSELEVDVSKLETFDDKILVKDIKISEKAKILAEPEEMVAFVEEVKEEVVSEEERTIADIEATAEKKESADKDADENADKNDERENPKS